MKFGNKRKSVYRVLLIHLVFVLYDSVFGTLLRTKIMIIISFNALNILFSSYELGFPFDSFILSNFHFMRMYFIARLMILVLMVIFMTILFNAKLSKLHIFVMIKQLPKFFGISGFHNVPFSLIMM